MLVHIMDQPELEKAEGPIGLILAPTRELSEQIHKETRKFSKPYGKRLAVSLEAERRLAIVGGCVAAPTVTHGVCL
jgi:superfamily II DNA/RNA helicase